jgi:non-heme chloroperoxidase
MIRHRCALLIVLAALTQLMTASTRASWNEGVVTSWDGAHIHYIESSRTISSEKHGSENHQPLLSVLFVPGYTMPAWIWEKQIGHFSAHYNVVAMDLRSQGESSKTGEGDYPVSHARDIKALIDQLHLAPVVLVGWSMAVTEIASYVEQFGTKGVAGIVLVDGVAGVDASPDYLKSTAEFLKNLQSNRLKVTSDFVRSIFRKQQPEEYIQRLISASMLTPTDSAVAVGLASATTDNRSALAGIDKPVLIVGATKRLLPNFQEMQKTIPGARLEFFDDAGHAVFVDDADKFNALLDQFVLAVNAR